MARYDRVTEGGGALSLDDSVVYYDVASGSLRRSTWREVLALAESGALDIGELPDILREQLSSVKLAAARNGRDVGVPMALLLDEIDDRVAADSRQGTDGTDGWTPVFEGETDGERRLIRIVDWIGGAGDRPPVGYLADGGAVTAVKADAMDVRGAAGQDGSGGGGGVGSSTRLGNTATNDLLIASTDTGAQDVTVWHLSLGASGTEATFRRATPASDVDVTARTITGTPAAFSDWTALEEITAGAGEAGAAEIKGHVDAVVVEDPDGGGDRVIGNIRLTRTRGAATETLTTQKGHYIRNNGQGQAAFNQATQEKTNDIQYDDVVQVGDVYKIEVRYIIQDTGGAGNTQTRTRTIRHASANENWIELEHLPTPGTAPALTTLLDAHPVNFPAGGAFADSTAATPEDGFLFVRMGDQVNPPVPASAVRGGDNASTGDAPSADNSILLGASGGGGGGGSVDFATQAEMLARTVGDKAASPLTVGELLTHLTATAADLDNGVAGQIVTAAILHPVLHALQTGLVGKMDTTAFLTTFLGLTLTEQEQSELRTLIGALVPEGEWTPSRPTEIADDTPVRSGTLIDTRFDIPAGATELRGSYQGDVQRGEYAFSFPVAELLAKPDLPAGGGSAGLLGGSLITRRVTGPGSPGTYDLGFGHIGRRLWIETDEDRAANARFTLQVQTRSGSIKRGALAGSGVLWQSGDIGRLGDANMPEHWNAFDDAEQAKLASLAPQAPSDWDADAGVARILNKPTIPPDPTTVPESDQRDANDVLVVQRSGRKDAMLSLADVSGSYFWGFGRGTLDAVPSTDASSTWNDVVKAVRWRPGTRLLTVWTVGAQWTRLYLGGVSYALTEHGASVVPWDTSGATFREASVTLSADAATYLTNDATGPKAVNLRDPRPSGSGYVVGNPFVREARLPIEEVTAPDIPAVRSIPPVADRATGDQWRLLVALPNVQQVAELTWDGSSFPRAEIPSPFGIYAPASGTFQGRLSVDRGSDTRTPTSIEIGDTSYALTPGGAQFRHLFTTAAGAVSLTSGTTYAVNVVFSDGTKLLAAINVDAGDVVAWDGYQLRVVSNIHTSEDVFNAIDDYQQDHGEFVTSTSGVTDIVVLTETAFQALVTAGTVSATTLYVRT